MILLPTANFHSRIRSRSRLYTRAIPTQLEHRVEQGLRVQILRPRMWTPIYSTSTALRASWLATTIISPSCSIRCPVPSPSMDLSSVGITISPRKTLSGSRRRILEEPRRPLPLTSSRRDLSIRWMMFHPGNTVRRTMSARFIWSGGAPWLAYSANRTNIRSGTFGTSDIRAWNQPCLGDNSAHVAFGEGSFSKTPHVFAALKLLDIERGRNIRVKLRTSNVSTSGMPWHLGSWGDTIQYSVGASYIAFAQ